MQRVITQQTGYTLRGEYAANARSGTMAINLAAEAEVLQFRWSPVSATDVCLVTEISMWAVGLTAFTAGTFIFRAAQAFAWSADGTGGSVITLTGNNGKVRLLNSWPTTQAAIRVATTAALGAGTKALDANGFQELAGYLDTTVGRPIVSPTAYLLGGSAPLYPLTLAKNEGFVLTANVPATGTWQFGATVRWQETGGFRL